MENPGEELVGTYLKYVLKCDFVEFNLNIEFVQGEIDVIGINLTKKIVYICEVAIHLAGIQYTKYDQPDNIDRFLGKFEKDIKYANMNFKDYDKIFMLWTPIVKDTKKGSKHNQLNDMKEIKKKLKDEFQIELQLIINEKFMDCINKLRIVAKQRTEELPTTIMRFLQIDEKLKTHLKRLNGKKTC